MQRVPSAATRYGGTCAGTGLPIQGGNDEKRR
nr:MAG TPA: hypothetical protein [Caudoviricetes sp.]